MKPPPLGHEVLLTLARKLEAAASDGERDRAEAAAGRLLDALVDHIRAEQPEMAHLSAGERGEVARDQQRLVDHLVESSVDIRNEDLARGDERARQLLAELTVQADDERRLGFAEARS